MSRPEMTVFGSMSIRATRRIGWLLVALLATVGIATGEAQGQRGRGRGTQGPPEITGRWSGTWSSFNPAQATTQLREVCKQLDADVVRNDDAWVPTRQASSI
jgi:hypothetical protein